MEPPVPPRRRHTLAWIIFVITFLLLVGSIGPEKVVHIDTSGQIATGLESSVVTPTFEDGIAHSTTGASAVHIALPQTVRGIYITAWTAGTPKRLVNILSMYDNSILNAVVIDIKDASGRISYQPLDGTLAATGVGTKRISNLPAVIEQFHQRGIYVIGRISVFQDPYHAQLHPTDTFTDIQTGEVWNDYKGIAWLRPDSVNVREYTEAIARDAYTQGFDEINLDYVRFPSDGDLKAIDLSGLTKSRAEVMQDFFVGISSSLRSEGIPVSADVFGLTMSASDDVGIGQKVALIAPHVDALAPMVYPSHFWNGTYGIAVPAEEPYKVIYKSMSDGIAKLASAGVDMRVLRPWLQDFDLVGVPYGSDKVAAQIQAAHDLGIDSWMLWDPANTYTQSVFKLTNEVE